MGLSLYPEQPERPERHAGGPVERHCCGKSVAKIRRRVGLGDVRIYDLRRTAASWLAINGSNLPVIQSMLNHRSLSSTQVYARLSVAPVRLALDDQADRMLGPVPVPMILQPPQTMVMAASNIEERGEWPG